MSQPHLPACPECGYDQSGAIASWETQCPIRGVCSECGHVFDWSEPFRICNEWGSEVGWYAEHAHNMWEMFDRTPGTLARLALPLMLFRGVNFRRAIRLKMLAAWLIFCAICLHVLVSPIGYAAHRAAGYAGMRSGGPFNLGEFLERQLTEIPSALLYPFFFLEFNRGGWDLQISRFFWDDWEMYMPLVWALVGASLYWVGVVGFILLVRLEEDRDTRHVLKLLARVSLLSLLPTMVYIQWVRVGFGIHAMTGMTASTNWVPISYLIMLVVCLFWQQMLWTRAIREVFEIRRSFFINVIGCFASIIFGVAILIMFL